MEIPNVPELDIPDITNPYEQMADQLQKKLNDLFSVFRAAWENQGQNTVEAAKRAFESLKNAVKSVAASFSEVWNYGTGQVFVENLLRLLQLVLNIIGDIAGAFTAAWEKGGAGTAFVQGLFDMWNAVFELILSIGEAFRTVWNNGTGVEIWSTILSIITNVENTVQSLAEKMKTAWEANDNGVQIWQHILNIGQDVLKFFDRISEATAEWAEGLNFEPLVSAFENLLDAVERLTASIGEGLGWVYENILLPFGKWVMETAAPAFLDAVAAVLGSPVWTSCASAIKDLYENALQPLAQWVGDKFLDFLKWIQENGDTTAKIIIGIAAAFAGWKVLEGIGAIVSGAIGLVYSAVSGVMTVISTGSGIISGFNTVLGAVTSPAGLVVGAIAAIIAILVYLYQTSDEFREKVNTAIENTKKIFNSLKETIQPIIEKFIGMFKSLWDDHLKPLVDQIVSFVEKIVSVVLDIYNACEPFISWLVNTAAVLIGNFCSIILGGAIAAIGAIADALGGILEALGGVIDFIAGVFTGDWNRAWEGIKSIFSGIWNALTGIVEGVMDAISNFISSVVDTIVIIFESLGIDLGDVWNGIKEGASTAWEGIKGVWNGTCDWFKTKVLEPAQKEFSKNWTLIKTAAKVSWEGVQDAWSNASSWFTSKVLEPTHKNFEKNWALIKIAASAAWDGIKGVWNGVSDWFSSIVNTPMKNSFSDMWDNVKNWANNALDAIKNTWKGLKDWFNDTVIKPIKDLWNNVTDVFKGSDSRQSGGYRRSVVNEVPRRVSYSIPQVPQFASGAVLRKPTLNLAAEYSGASSNPEIVTPESLMREVFVESLMPLVSALHEEFSRLIEANGDGNIIVKIGDDTIVKHAIKGINDITRRNGKSPLK